MPKRSNEYQKLIYLIRYQIAQNSVVTESKMLRDKATGKDREIDIVIDSHLDNKILTLCIECCDRSRKADVEWVEQMWAKHQDLPTDKLILASRNGYTKAARLKAKAHEIDIIDYKDAIIANWSKITQIWKEPFLVSIAMQSQYQLEITRDNQDDAFILISGDEMLTDTNAQISFSVSQLINILLKMYSIEERLLHETEINSTKSHKFRFSAPTGRYALMTGAHQATLKSVTILVQVHKKGRYVSIQHALLDSMQVIHSTAEVFGKNVLISVTEDTEHQVRAAMHLQISSGTEQVITLKSSEDLKND